MAFWGAVIKPGKPVTHSCEKASGRLRITQATLGIGEATKKIFVQCNVGNRSPVLLCVLVPNTHESLHLDLEFEEADDVVFSVIGPRTVYLTGYYVRESRHLDGRSDSESYGVDIQNSQTEVSSYCSDDDKYENSFIDDDGNLHVAPPSPASSVKEEDKPKGTSRGRRLRNRSQVIESDDDTNSLKSEDEDEDGYLLSIFKSKRDAKRTEEHDQVAAEIGDEVNHKSLHDSKPMEKVGDEDANGRTESEAKMPLEDEVTPVENENDELSKKVDILEEVTANSKQALTDDKFHENTEEASIIDQKLAMNNEKDQTQSLDITKPKKKRKERSKGDEKTNEVEIDKDQMVFREDKQHETEASKNMEIGVNSLASPPESGSRKGQKLKKRRKEVLAGACPEDIVPGHNIAEEGKLKQGSAHADITMEDMPAANGEYKGQQNDNNVTMESELLSIGNQPEKKNKKKTKRKSHDKEDLNIDVPNATTDNQETTFTEHVDQPTSVPNDKRTLSNGLTIEVLANGPPNGKIAEKGKKVKIHYTASLKDNGYIFDTNVGEAPCKFRLGDDQFIDGWNIGIDGMRVGEKRRLVIPPSLGYGNHEAVENVPPNSWLVYDVELLGVYK